MPENEEKEGKEGESEVMQVSTTSLSQQLMKIACFIGQEIEDKNFLNHPQVSAVVSRDDPITFDQIPCEQKDVVILLGHGDVKGGVDHRGEDERAVISIFKETKDVAEVVLAVKERMHPKIIVISGCYLGAARSSLEAVVEQLDEGTTLVIPASSKHSSSAPMGKEFLDSIVKAAESPDLDIETFTANRAVRHPQSLIFMRVSKNMEGKKEMVSVKFISPKNPATTLPAGRSLEDGLKTYFSTTALYDNPPIAGPEAAMASTATTSIPRLRGKAHQDIANTS